jgi:hypothetical protein
MVLEGLNIKDINIATDVNQGRRKDCIKTLV